MPSKATKTNLVEIGRIVGAFGIQGELKCDPSNAGRTLFSAGAILQSDRDDIVITSVREHKGRLLLRIEGVESATDAQVFTGIRMYTTRDNVEKTLEANEYLDENLIGCSVHLADETFVGDVDDVQHYPASDMLIVKGQMIPLVGAFIREIDMENKRIVVDLPEGLID